MGVTLAEEGGDGETTATTRGGKGPCRAGFGDSRPIAMTPPCPFCKSLHVEHLNDHGGFVCFGCGWWFVLDALGNCLDQGPTQHAALSQRRWSGAGTALDEVLAYAEALDQFTALDDCSGFRVLKVYDRVHLDPDGQQALAGVEDTQRRQRSQLRGVARLKSRLRHEASVVPSFGNGVLGVVDGGLATRSLRRSTLPCWQSRTPDSTVGRTLSAVAAAIPCGRTRPDSPIWITRSFTLAAHWPCSAATTRALRPDTWSAGQPAVSSQSEARGWS